MPDLIGHPEAHIGAQEWPHEERARLAPRFRGGDVDIRPLLYLSALLNCPKMARCGNGSCGKIWWANWRVSRSPGMRPVHDQDRTTTSPVDVAEAVVGAPFPCSKEQLLEHARRIGATEEALDTLLSLPDRVYQDPSEVMQWVRG